MRMSNESRIAATLVVALGSLSAMTIPWLSVFLLVVAIAILFHDRFTPTPYTRAQSEGLKVRGLKLSSEILAYVARRKAIDPTYTQSANSDRAAAANRLVGHYQETMSLHSRQFGARVIAMQKELHMRGFHDKELDAFYEHPTNPLGIQTVGERLGALAHQLPEE